MARSKFINNKAEISGGGVYFKSVEQMTINDTEFSKNQASSSFTFNGGGGFFAQSP